MGKAGAEVEFGQTHQAGKRKRRLAEAFVLDRLHESLGDCIQIGRSEREPLYLDPLTFENLIKLLRELGIAILQELASFLAASANSITRLRACCSTQGPSGWGVTPASIPSARITTPQQLLNCLAGFSALA